MNAGIKMSSRNDCLCEINDYIAAGIVIYV